MIARLASSGVLIGVLIPGALLVTLGIVYLAQENPVRGANGREHFFPAWTGAGSRLGAHAGLLITSAIVLVVSNLVDLSAIASVGSAISLVIFMLVGVAAYRRRAETGSQALIVSAAIAATAVVVVFFAVDTLRNAPETFTAIVVIAALAVLLDLVWKRVRPSPTESTPESQLTPSAQAVKESPR